MSEQNTPIEEHQDVNKLIAERKHKLAGLREQGNAFPNDFRRDADHTIALYRDQMVLFNKPTDAT